MATRWDVTRAVRGSTLDPQSRLVMFVLADLADADTAQIPTAFSPSLTQLTRETGLSRSTVANRLNALEEGGWVKRARPTVAAARSRKVTTDYALSVPSSAPHGLVRPTDQTASAPHGLASAPHGLELVRGADQASAPHGLVTYLLTKPTKSLTTSPKSGTRAKREPKPAKPPEERADVEELCARLADGIVANGSLRPTITKEWRAAARLLLDKDGRALDKAIALVDWCQNDRFWRGNIRSMPTFREKYDALRLKALADWEQTRVGKHQPYQNPTDQSVYDEEL